MRSELPSKHAVYIESDGVCLRDDFELVARLVQAGSSDMLVDDHTFAAEARDASRNVMQSGYKVKARDVVEEMHIAFVLICYPRNASAPEALVADDV